MSQLQRHLLGLGIVLLLSTSVKAQSGLQHIRIQERVLRWNLADFIRQTKAKWIAVTVELDSIDQGYIYQIDAIHTHDDVLAYDGDIWGEWQQVMLLFYTRGDVDLQAIYQLSDTTDRLQLQHDARLSLPGNSGRTDLNRFNSRGRTQRCLKYTFKVVNGQEAYSSDDDNGYSRFIDKRGIPPVPEHD